MGAPPPLLLVKGRVNIRLRSLSVKASYIIKGLTKFSPCLFGTDDVIILNARKVLLNKKYTLCMCVSLAGENRKRARG